MKIKIALLTSLALLTLGACAEPSRSSLTSEPPPPVHHSPRVVWPNWSQPLGGSDFATRVADVEEAQGLAHFSLIEPPLGWGTPTFLDAGSPDSSGERDSVAWMYSGDGGEPLYLLIESSPPSMDQKSLEAAATCLPDEVGCQQQNFSLAFLDDGTPALLVRGEVARILHWLKGDVEMILAGPLATFNADSAVKMASEI
jgi:hypothetical protein